MHSHRSTTKQANKSFKSRHASKSSLKAKAKGKVGKRIGTKTLPSLTKPDRKNQAKLQLLKKKSASMDLAKLFHSTAKIIAIVPLCPDVDTLGLSKTWCENLQVPFDPLFGACSIPLPKQKTQLQTIAASRNLISILDACKVADLILFVISANEPVDAFGEACLSAIKVQGVPSVLSVVQHLESHPLKKQVEIRKSLLYYMEHQFPGDHKLFSFNASDNETELGFRYLASVTPKSIGWRDRHSYMVAEKLGFTVNQADPSFGTLSMTGTVRGHDLNLDRLIHLPGHGDFQIESVQILKRGQESVRVPNPESQESLVLENEPDLMDAEQTWPTDEELQDAQDFVESKREPTEMKPKKKVLKGTSSYQAAWIIDEAQSEEEESDVDMEDQEDQDSQSDSESELEFEDVQEEDRDEMENELDEEEDEKQLAEYLARKKESGEDMQFPDEVDTPMHIPARERFQRYRGLKSFRSSPWDSYENLPVDYARIFQFKNFKRNRQTVLKTIEEENELDIPVGTHVILNLKNVPASIQGVSPSALFCAFSLLPNERKMTVVNFSIQRSDGYTEPIKSKDPMILMSGFRRYIVHPVYSTYTRGGANNVHRYTRFLHTGSASVATVYAPVQYGPAPIQMFKYEECNWTPESMPTFVGTGTVLDSDPMRIIAKRILLTGHPFKVNKRSAVIRFLFFNPEDVEYFKPVQLTTKLGRCGHIKESLGTHGYMKCVFDGQLKQHDTVCMALYKRVFPKWTTVMYSPRNSMDLS